jgi:hypothetical protein
LLFVVIGVAPQLVDVSDASMLLPVPETTNGRALAADARVVAFLALSAG